MSDTPSLTITGTVETCLEKETFPSGFSKRVLVVNTGGEYPQSVPVEFVKDKADLLTGLVKGQPVTAHINIRGSEYNGKYYANVQGWRLERGEGGQAPAPAPTPAPAAAAAAVEDDEEIPF